MKPPPFLTAALLTIFVLGLTPLAAKTDAAPANRAIVAEAFERWSRHAGTPFDLLADDATWTILGPTPTAGTYSIPRLREEILTPFQARLETPLTPQVRAIHEDGDTVIVLFEASARLKGGDRYANSYVWFFRFENGRVQNVTAVLDLTAFDQVLALGK